MFMFMLLCGCVHMNAGVQRPQNGVGSPGDGVLSCCESPHMGFRNWARVFNKSSIHCRLFYFLTLLRYWEWPTALQSPSNSSSNAECLGERAFIALTGDGISRYKVLAKAFGQGTARVLKRNLIILTLPWAGQPGPCQQCHVLWFLPFPARSLPLSGRPHFLLTQSNVLQLPAVRVHGPVTLYLCAKASHLLHPNLFTAAASDYIL